MALDPRQVRQGGVPALLEAGIARLAELQDRLYAQDRWGLLVIFQAMDAAGKDSTIKHVMSGVNPQGVQVSSFKVPSAEELDHDFLWRSARRLPERGRIGIFNRSYYEEVLVVRVHPDDPRGRRSCRRSWSTARSGRERYEDINAFERYLARNGFPILKFFLNVSKKEQKRRFLERLDKPEKNWKFSIADVREREFWSDYRKAYEEAIARDQHAVGAVVRRPRRPQVVHAARRRRPRSSPSWRSWSCATRSSTRRGARSSRPRAAGCGSSAQIVLCARVLGCRPRTREKEGL